MPTLEELRKTRLEKIERLKEAGINPYPADLAFEKRDDIADLLDNPKVFSEKWEGGNVVVAGRIRALRRHGGSTFFDVEDETGRIQCHLAKDQIESAEKYTYDIFTENIDVGDIVECRGQGFITKTEQKTIQVTSWFLLVKALRPLPEEWYGLKDTEERFRRRYLDLLMNPELKEVFRRKSAFWHAMRRFLLEKGFFEVETPVLEVTPGGADAKAFVTHHDALDIDMHLRISMGELWQKRLMVAGFDKTFEIGRQFRNEGMSREHLQDYTQMEFYWAYADYRDAMKLSEELYKNLAQETWGTLSFDIGAFAGVDLGQEWKEVDYVDVIQEQVSVDILAADEDDLRAKLEELGVTHKEINGRGRLIDAIWKHCRKKIKGPAFVMHHPVAVSPLAKRHPDNSDLTERFQILIAGSEMGNGYTELNDPLDQAKRFQEQAKLREEGDPEAQMHDKEFVEALEYGMPPTAGFGVSERLFSFLEDKAIRETVLFPLMKPKE